MLDKKKNIITAKKKKKGRRKKMINIYAEKGISVCENGI